jgi:hypothetical protein
MYHKKWVDDEVEAEAAGGLTGRSYVGGPGYLLQAIQNAGGSAQEVGIPDAMFAQVRSWRLNRDEPNRV